MMKLKVLPELMTGCARLALVLRMVFSLPPVCESSRRVVGGSSKGWQGHHLHPEEAAPSVTGRVLEWDMATSTGLSGAPCCHSPLQGLVQ